MRVPYRLLHVVGFCLLLLAIGWTLVFGSDLATERAPGDVRSVLVLVVPVWVMSGLCFACVDLNRRLKRIEERLSESVPPAENGEDAESERPADGATSG